MTSSELSVLGHPASSDARIAVIGLRSNENIGDELLCVTVEWLLSKAGCEEEARYDLCPYLADAKTSYVLVRKSLSLLFRIANALMPGGRLSWFFGCLRQKWVFQKSGTSSGLKKADGIVMPGGLLRGYPLTVDFSYELVTQIAKQNGIPVMFNAVGARKTGHMHYRERRLFDSLSASVVASVTTREGAEGREALADLLHREDVREVGDPAFWIPEVYGVERDPSARTIGIGAIRPNIFIDYGGDLASEQVERLYIDLLTMLEHQNEEWRLFTNGMEEDYEFAVRIIRQAGLPQERLLPKPRTPRELLDQVAGFGVVMGARLHACIIAYSLDVPCCGFAWSEKVRRVAQSIGRDEFFIDEASLTADALYRTIKSASATGYDVELRNERKKASAEAIGDFVRIVHDSMSIHAEGIVPPAEGNVG